ILTITFTRKAAAEMMDRIRDYMRHPDKTGIEYGEEERERLSAACREIERARISTIDSFCSGVLRANALSAGIDPEFATADENQEAVLKQEAFDAAIKQLLDEHQDEAANLIAAYDDGLTGRLFETINGLYNKFRSWGLKPELPVPGPPDLNEARRRLKEAVDEARAAVEREGVSGSRVEKCMEATVNILAALDESQVPACFSLMLTGKPHMGVKQAVKDSFIAVEEQRQAFITALVASEAARTKTVPMLARHLELFAGSYADIKRERGVLDFSDLAIMTRDLLRETESVRKRVASIYEFIMVDEFQDTSRVQYEIMELLARDNLMLVGDKNQSIYGFRDAEV
ncbi:MAG: UvrD-helicase domain-containing protein, partial [Actinomycetota bacterium]